MTDIQLRADCGHVFSITPHELMKVPSDTPVRDLCPICKIQKLPVAKREKGK